MIRRGVLAGSLLSALPLAAQVAPATPPAQAAAPDFSAGLQRLAALGLPELKGAQWIERSDEEGYDENTYRLQKVIEGMKGGAWLITGADGQLQSLGLGQIQLAPAKTTTTTRRGGLVGAIFGGSKEQARKSCDPKADAAKLIANLINPEKSEDLKSSFRYYGTAGTETLLLFAAQLHQAGHTAEANQLALALLQFVPNPEAVIDAAIGRFADREYDALAGAFFASKDWAAYERGLKQLLEKYPRGWASAPLVQQMLPKVADRASGKPAPALQGTDLNADARAALEAIFAGEKSGNSDDKLQAWAKQRGMKLEDLNEQQRESLLEYIGQMDSRSGSCWLLESAAEGDSPSARLTRCGMDALPVLLAAMQDETLTLNRNAASRSRSHIFFNESSAEQLAKRYAAMNRPMARKEMARRWLAPVLPGDLDEASDDAIAESAREFIKQYRGKPKLELLLAYLRDGTESQKALAANALIVLNDAAADKAFEDFVMGGDFLNTLEHTRTYLKARKGKASGFYERYAKAFRDALADVDLEESSGGYRLKQYGGVEKHLKKLEMLVGKTSSRDLALKLAAAESPDTKQIRALIESLHEESREKLLEVIAEAASQAKSAETACFMLGTTIMQLAKGTSDDDPPQSKPAASQAVHWKKLLNDKRAWRSPIVIADIAAITILFAHDATYRENSHIMDEILGKDRYKVLLDNALAVCEGKTPNWPDAKKVSADRVQELLSTLTKIPAKDIHAQVKSWSPDERMAWMEWSNDTENASKTPATVIEARQLIVAADNSSELAKHEVTRLGLTTGEKFDLQTIRKCVTKLAQDQKEPSHQIYFFRRNLNSGIAPQVPDAPGFDISRYITAAAQAPFKEDEQIVKAIAIRGHGQSYIWKIGKTDTDLTQLPKDFDEKVQALLDQSNNSPAASFLFIGVITRDDFKKTEDDTPSEEE